MRDAPRRLVNVTSRLIDENARKLMRGPNTIVNFYNKCELEHKFIFRGPGTQALSQRSDWSRMPRSVAGGLYGSVGEDNVHANLEQAKNIIRAQAKLAKKENNGQLIIHLSGWSRGAYTVWLLKKVLQELKNEGVV